MFGWLVSQFLKGCLVLFPIVGTTYAVWFLLSTVDRLVAGVIELPAPGLGLVVAVVGITVVGIVASNVVGRTVVRRFDRLVDRVPLIGLVYGAIRDIVGAFVGERRSFDRPAMVDLGGVRVFGFVTNEALDDPRLAGCVAVYLPQSYNFAGNLVIVDRSKVERIDAKGSEFLAFVVSGGVHALEPPRDPGDHARDPDGVR
ncbi:MAG: DUF502 domain-containing protein [Myxococcota bacterium]